MRVKSFFLGRSVSISLMFLVLFTGGATIAFADDQPQGESIPTGVRITPTAAAGSTFSKLNPDLPNHPDFTVGQAVTTAVSPDGSTLLILTSGYNSQNDANGNTDPAQSNEYVFVYDISSDVPVRRQVLQIVPNAFDGLAWNPNGKEFYVSGGTSDNIHVFTKSQSGWAEASGSPIALGHPFTVNPPRLGFIPPAVAGLAVNAAGTTLVAANYENDSISIVDIASRTKIAELSLKPGQGIAGGEFPFWVVIKGNSKAYVSSERDREIVVVDFSNPATPAVTGRIHVQGVPNKMLLSPKRTRLYVALGNSDSVGIISTKTDSVVNEVSTFAPASAFANAKRFNGINPNSVALSPDGLTLYVTNGGANSLAVVRLQSAEDAGVADGAVAGLIPTGWYPNSASVSADGTMLYVVNGKSNTGPVPDNCRNTTSIAPGSENACNAANQYVWQLTKAGFQTVPTPSGEELDGLTQQVGVNNGYARLTAEEAEDDAAMQLLRSNVKHVIYIVKENRTYDQILGDLGKGNGDPSIAIFPQPLSPNFHKIANNFVDLDNFYDSGEVSGDGWNWSTSARASDTIEKTEPINYAGRGLNYDYEGTNRNVNVGYATPAERISADPINPADPDLLPGTGDVSAPDSSQGEIGTGYLWDGALRAGLKVRNYGFFIDLTRYSLPASLGGIPPTITDPFGSNTLVAFPTKAALQPITDQYFRGYDNKFPDFYRVNEWEREFRQFEQSGDLPNLEFVRVMHDHFGAFGSAIAGVNTVETQIADNDYAVGRIVDIVSHSGKYKGNTLIFVIEDDSQDGPDHVDAHRSTAFIAGPFVKQGAVVSTRYTTVNMIHTICDILGIEPLGINDATARAMSDVFTTQARAWNYKAVVPEVLFTTQLPLVQDETARRRLSHQSPLWAAYSKPRHDAAYWEEKTKGFDFTREDRLDARRFNLILWEGMKGEGVAYPTVRDGRDLRKDREQLLKSYFQSATADSYANKEAGK